MDTTNNGVLNLDEMLGDKKLIVKIQGRDYPIRTVKSLTPGEFGKVMAYGTKLSSLTEDDMTLNDGATVMQAIDDVIQIIAPSLPRYKPSLVDRLKRGYKRRFAISMQEATAIMQFWTEQNRQAKNARGAVMPVRKMRR